MKAARESLGLSRIDYARLIARAHGELGFGVMMVKTHYTVLHWESGRNEPNPNTQLAIAHIHGVNPEEVLRLGWPYWLDLATDDAAPVNQPWTPQGAIVALHGMARPADARPRSRLAVTGPALDSQIRKPLPRGTPADHHTPDRQRLRQRNRTPSSPARRTHRRVV